MKNDVKFKKLSIIIPLLGVSRGGGIRVVAELANGLVKRGHLVTVITPPITSFPFPLDEKVNLISRNKIKKRVVLGRFSDYLFIYKEAVKSGEIVLSNYYTTFFIGFLLNLLHGKKHVYFIQGYEPDFFEINESLINKIKSFLAKMTYKIKPSLRITISKFIKNKIGKDDIVIINDGIDPKLFKPSINKKNDSSKKIISTIALDLKRKGFYDFIKAIEVLSNRRKDFEILLFTSQQNIKLDLSFQYTIVYPKNDIEIAECLNRSDVFVSASHLEGFGLPGLEAMACGSALITSNSGGVVEYAMNEKNSLIFEVGNVNDLVVCIERMLDDSILHKDIVREGLLTAERFTWDIMCENFEKEFNKLYNKEN